MDTEDGASASGALSAAIVENIEKTAATYVAAGRRFWGVACPCLMTRVGVGRGHNRQAVAGPAKAGRPRVARIGGVRAVVQGTYRSWVLRRQGGSGRARSRLTRLELGRGRRRCVPFQQTAVNTGLHSTSTPGITALALHPDGVRVLTGGT